MMKRTALLLFSVLLLWSVLCFAAPFSGAEDDHPIRLTVASDPETELETEGTISYLLFTITNTGSEPYTLHEARLSGGFDGTERTLNGDITIEAGGEREFNLYDVPVADAQLDTDIVYTLSWTEVLTISTPTEEPTASTEPGGEEGGVDVEVPLSKPTPEPMVKTSERQTSATIRIPRFVPPVLTVSASVSAETVAAGETFTVTYRIANETKYDMTNLRLTDPAVFDGAIPLPGTELMAGATITVPVEYTMADTDMVIWPVATYIAAQRQTETAAKDAITVGSVVVGVRIDVQQYPSNEDGTTFVITVTNTGNRAMRQIQVYDEINSEIDRPFDLGPQQQKVLTFNVPSAYAAGLVRTVRFRLTAKDYFNNDFSFIDANSYDCIPYIASDSVRLSLLVTLINAYYDDAGKLCGEIQFEIRNYSDVRVLNATLSELTLFGTVQTFDELQRGETFYTTVYQLDNVDSLSFRVNASDTAGQAYATETIALNLEQLPTLAARTEQQTIIYHSNTFLQNIADRIEAMFRDTLVVALIVVIACVVACLVLWLIETKIRAKLPRESLLALHVPTKKRTPTGAIDHVFGGSPAEQLGYTAPAKLRYAEAGEKKPTTRSGEELFGDMIFSAGRRRSEGYWANPAEAAPHPYGKSPAPTFEAFLRQQGKAAHAIRKQSESSQEEAAISADADTPKKPKKSVSGSVGQMSGQDGKEKSTTENAVSKMSTESSAATQEPEKKLAEPERKPQKKRPKTEAAVALEKAEPPAATEPIFAQEATGNLRQPMAELAWQAGETADSIQKPEPEPPIQTVHTSEAAVHDAAAEKDRLAAKWDKPSAVSTMSGPRRIELHPMYGRRTLHPNQIVRIG